MHPKPRKERGASEPSSMGSAMTTGRQILEPNIPTISKRPVKVPQEGVIPSTTFPKLDDTASLNVEPDTKSTVCEVSRNQQQTVENPTTKGALTRKRKPDSVESVENTVNKRKRAQAQPADMPSQLRPAQAVNPNENITTNPQTLEDQLNNISREVEKKEKEIETIKEKLEHMEEKIKRSRESERKQSEHHIAPAKSTAANLKKELKVAKFKLEEKDSTVYGLLRENGQQDEKIKRLLMALREYEKKDSERAEIQQASGTIRELREKTESLQMELCMKGKEARSRKQQASDTIEKLSHEIECLREKNQEQLETSDELRATICEYAEKLEDRKEIYTKVCDGTIVEGWTNMMHLIGQTVANCMQGRPQGKMTASTRKKYPDGVLKLAERMRSFSPGIQIQKLQAYLWRRIVQDTFRSGEALWGGAVGSAFTDFCMKLEVESFQNAEAAALFSTIKSTAAHQLDAAMGTHEANMEKYIDHLLRDVSIFATKEMEEDGLFRNHLAKIVYQAHMLRVIMMKSRAIFRIQWPALLGLKGSMIPGPDKIQIVYRQWTTEKAEQEVLSVVSPALLKCGLADGHGFENHTRLFSATIVVDEPKTAEEMRQLEAQRESPGSGTADSAKHAGRNKKRSRKAVVEPQGDNDEAGDTASESSHGSKASNWSTDR